MGSQGGEAERERGDMEVRELPSENALRSTEVLSALRLTAPLRRPQGLEARPGGL